MKLIEKLGLKDWDDDKKEMLEALVAIGITLESQQGFFLRTVPLISRIAEKATGRTWREIKELMDA